MIYLLGALLDSLVFLGFVVMLVPTARLAEEHARVITLRRVLIALVPATLVFLARALLLSTAGGFFALVHVLYLEIVLALPLAATGVLVAGSFPTAWPLARRLTTSVRCVAILSLLPAPIGVWASFVEPYRLQLERSRVALSARRAGESPLTIGVLADLQTDRITDHERRAVRRLVAGRPDIIVLPGDLFQGSLGEFERELPALRGLLRELQAPGGVFFVTGNTDRSLADLHRALDGSQVEIIANGVREVRVRDRRVRIAGLDAEASRTGTLPLQKDFESEPGDDDVRILLGHYPDMFLALAPDSRVDLTIAGHTHGGQICLPWFGPPLTLTSVPRRVAAGGYHEVDGRGIYVSRGVGMERAEAPRIRFLCPPEISLLTLE